MKTRHAGDEMLLRLLEESYDKPAWHGPNLRGSLRGLTALEAAWKPASARHSIWELALHCAYWEYAVERKLAGGKRGSFPRKPSNFPAVPPEGGAREWKLDLELLDQGHARLLRTVEEACARLAPASEAGQRARRLIRGAASHNVYHAGQIRLLIRMSGAKRSRR